MADTKTTGLTAITAPALTDIVPIVSSPGSSPLTQKITVQNLRGGYTLQASASVFNPADATSYFFGGLPTSAPSTSTNLFLIQFPRSGTITAASLFFHYGATGSNETSTVKIRLQSNPANDVTISSSITSNADTLITNTSLSTAVTAGQYFEILWTTPTWATNPTSVFLTATLYIS